MIDYHHRPRCVEKEGSHWDVAWTRCLACCFQGLPHWVDIDRRASAQPCASIILYLPAGPGKAAPEGSHSPV